MNFNSPYMWAIPQNGYRQTKVVIHSEKEWKCTCTCQSEPSKIDLAFVIAVWFVGRDTPHSHHTTKTQLGYSSLHKLLNCRKHILCFQTFILHVICFCFLPVVQKMYKRYRGFFSGLALQNYPLFSCLLHIYNSWNALQSTKLGIESGPLVAWTRFSQAVEVTTCDGRIWGPTLLPDPVEPVEVN